MLSRHQIAPTKLEWAMIKRVMQYLSGTKHYGLTYEAKSEGLVVYSDASLGDSKNSLTTCGFVIELYGDSVAWKTHKQTSVGLSTCEAEYLSMSDACQDLMSLHNSIKFIVRREMYPMTLYCDNIYIRSTEQGENFKSSETWLYLFKIMKKTQKPIFSAIYANLQKLF